MAVPLQVLMAVTAVPAVAHRGVVTVSVYLVTGFRLSVLNRGFLPLFCWGSSVCRALPMAGGEVLDLLSYLHVPSDVLLLHREAAPQTLQVTPVKPLENYWGKNSAL